MACLANYTALDRIRPPSATPLAAAAAAATTVAFVLAVGLLSTRQCLELKDIRPQ